LRRVITLRVATDGDAEAVHRLIDGAARWTTERGIRQWRPGQWSLDDVRGWIATGEVRVALRDGAIVGTVRIQDVDETFWPGASRDAGYIHRLVSDRALMGKGIGSAIVDLAEAEIARRGFHFARLDTGAENPALMRFYLERGYVLIEERDMQRAFGPAGEMVRWRAALLEKRLSD
jgi:ribosomal protein S18 acetylase RimI-like enzyme